MAGNDKIKDTLNLPRTSFSMKAKLAQREPEFLAKWEEIKLYENLMQERKQCPPFVLHDGPPYANGNIHLGTALNKILKDFIVRSKLMKGFKARYVPGWDCHGLPIEIKVDKNLGEKKKSMSIIKIREECKKYALKYVEIQKDQFKRLGVLGTWDKPYLTMRPEYEGDVLRFLAAFFESGNVYKGKKPVYWCANCGTALAEAEIEYKEHKSPSIFVKFPLISDLSQKHPNLKGKKVSVLIWTTTPWTIPANLAIAFHPDFEYAAFQAGEEVFIAARRLIPVLAETLGFKKTHILATFSGKEIEGLKAKHPFIERGSLFVLADYVTLDQGTGAVHTAPGHGYDDYLTGLKYKMDIYTPVDEEGKFVSDVEKYAGMNVFAANNVIVQDMKQAGTLLKTENIVHSYPHCWRCKQPVIFRATAQWFISMDESDLRQNSLKAINDVQWIPSGGGKRIKNMVKVRPDWCISRQRTWGVPIPSFNCQKCGTVLANKKITLHIADIFTKEGTNSWFIKSAKELLPLGTKCSECGSNVFEKENNILDVWFESGASQSILGKSDDLPWPADVYIEGHDQYRGWFNSSLLVGVAVRNKAPFKTCIIHGFVLDEKGRAMSKSLGNIIEPEKIVSKNGAEILRLWIAMLNYQEDARFGKETMQRLIEAYRKIRNTWRFILGNIDDFSPDKDSIALKDMEIFDRWILEKVARTGKEILKAYDEYEYHTVFHKAYNLFTVGLSSYYLDVIKDRLYCSGKNSRIRKSAQTALLKILKDTLILMAPILPFTTDEAWENMPNFKTKSKSVHLELFPSFKDTILAEKVFEEWEKLIPIREKVLKELELAREEKLIGNSLEAGVDLHVPPSYIELAVEYEAFLASLFIVSEVKLVESSGDEFEVNIFKVKSKKCQRCWNYSPSVGKSSFYPEFCKRCEDVVKEINN